MDLEELVIEQLQRAGNRVGSDIAISAIEKIMRSNLTDEEAQFVMVQIAMWNETRKKKIITVQEASVWRNALKPLIESLRRFKDKNV